MAKKKKREEAFVLDGSVTLAWFFEDETDAYAESIEDALARAKAYVPAIWWLEVANAVLVGERRGRTTEAKATAFLSLLQRLPIVADEETIARAWHETLISARAHGLSVYDASYLEVALRRGLPLATLDDKLKTAATAVGVAEYAPVKP
jgi:predicted nucleic acid-binding protein